VAAVADVFISYKREERTRCERIATKLRGLGLDVWFDAKLEAGKNFDREIESAVARSKAVLVLWSPSAVDSQWVRNEAGYGLKNEKLVAARLHPCDPPLAFSAVHFEDLLNPAFQDDDPSWLRLLERISTLVGRPSIVSYSQALAKAAIPLEEWARENAADPLAVQIKEKADLLGGVDPAAAAAARRQRIVAPVVVAAIAALAIGIAGGFVSGRLMRPATADAAVTSAAISPEQAAATNIIGHWGALDAQGTPNCNPHEMEIWMGEGSDEILVVAFINNERQLVAHQSIGALREGALVMRGDEGEFTYRYEAAGENAPAKLTVTEADRSYAYGACS